MQAAPSENSPVAIRLLFDLSLFKNVSEQSSVAATAMTASGLPEAILKASAIPDTPPAHPNPQIGILFMPASILSLFTTNASILGVERPVLETKIRSVASQGDNPALPKAYSTASEVSLIAMFL